MEYLEEMEHRNFKHGRGGDKTKNANVKSEQ